MKVEIEWVPVTERLPELGIYLITDKNGDVYADVAYDYEWNDDVEPIFYKWFGDVDICFKPDVIAWGRYSMLYKKEVE